MTCCGFECFLAKKKCKTLKVESTVAMKINVICLINRHDAVNLPSTEEGLSNYWCQTIWAEKKERLRLFYKDRKFVDSTYNEEVLTSQLEEERKAKCTRHRKTQILYKLAIFYFIFIPVVVV